MANPERLTALIAEYRGLDPVREVARICPLLAEAAALVDREVEPKKWAALRGLYGRFATDLAPESALAAYLEALTVWNPEADRETWVGCHASVGLLYLRLHPLGSTEADQAIVHLELAVNDQQTLAATLGNLGPALPAQNFGRSRAQLAATIPVFSVGVVPHFPG